VTGGGVLKANNSINLDETRVSLTDLRVILEAIPVAVCIVDAEKAGILYVNDACVKMFRFDSYEHMKKKKARELLASFQPTGEAPDELLERIPQSTSERFTREIQCVANDGRIIEVLLNAARITYRNKGAFIGIMTDLTKEKEYGRMLLSTAEKEKEANQLKSHFLVNMSHEIRTPMNAIIGLTEIELRKEIGKNEAEIYTKINKSAKNLLDIINDILDMSKIEADKAEVYEDEFVLEDVLESAMLVATPRLDGKNVEFLLKADLSLPKFLIGDKTKLWQVLKNFLDNAAKFTEKGKIVFSVSGNAEKSNSDIIYVDFEIKDTGCGISDEDMQRLFRPYSQIYTEAQKKYTGTGLGMAISKQFCSLMGGDMEIESTPGLGTSISLGIPFRRSHNYETETEALKYPELKGARILAVDDDELSLNIMREILTGAGCMCETALSGEEALQIIFEYHDLGKDFDIILLDYMLDGIDGLETARRIQTGLSKAPKLLMVTAYQRLLIRRELEKVNIDDIIEKPFVPTLFINKIRRYFTDVPGMEYAELPQFKDVTVLLCEDYLLNQEVAREMLLEFGIKTVTAENGKIGIDILTAGDKTFDLILMDLQMPVMDGYEAARIIRADSRFDHIPIISLTADAMKEVEDRCFEAGMNDHVTKPVEFEALEQALLKWLPDGKRLYNEGTQTRERKPSVPWEYEGLSQKSAIARFGGKRELYEKALREFAKDLPVEWPQFSYIAANIDEAQKQVHKIKGVAGNLSENYIYRYAAEFESSLRLSRPDQELYIKLKSSCDEFKMKVIANNPEVDQNLPMGSAKAFSERIEEMKEALNSFDLKRCSKAADRLKEMNWPISGANRAALERLCELAENYDYDTALDVIERMSL